MVILDNTVVNIALPTAQHDLGFSNADRQWVVTAYALAFGSLLLLGGWIGDIFGRKRTLIIGLVGFAGASAIGGASVNFAMLVIARTVQGAFGALLAPSVLALLTTTFTDSRERGKAFAIYGGIAGAGGALGLLLGGVLTSDASWRWTLSSTWSSPLSPLPALALAEERQGRRPRSAGLPGLLLVTSGLFCLVYGFSHAETTAWSNPSPSVSWLRGDPAAAFALLERRVRYPLLRPGSTEQDERRFGTGHAVRQHWAVRGLPVPDLLPAGHTQLQPGQNRLRLSSHDRGARGDGAGVQPGAAARFGPKVIVPIGLFMTPLRCASCTESGCTPRT